MTQGYLRRVHHDVLLSCGHWFHEIMLHNPVNSADFSKSGWTKRVCGVREHYSPNVTFSAVYVNEQFEDLISPDGSS